MRHNFALTGFGLAATLLSGCVTRPPLQFTCNGFIGTPVGMNAVMRSIVQDQGRPADEAPDSSVFTQAALEERCALADPIAAAVLQARGACGPPDGSVGPADADRPSNPARQNRPHVLVLSGGGQWGAFGAGFIDGLHERGVKNPSDPHRLPQYTIIAGVSTGAMQALLLGDTEDAVEKDGNKYQRLVAQYTIGDESEIVNRGWRPLALVTGSMAGLDPLVGRIRTALCPDEVVRTAADVGDANCLLTRLASRRGPRVFVGYVEAREGQMKYADLNALAGTYGPGHTPAAKLAHARDCVTAAAIASAAMPAFYQQVQVKRPLGSEREWQTLLDGGVRQSVFLPAVLNSVAVADRLAGTSKGEETRIDVVRNGPTKAKLNEEADEAGNVIDKAFATYDLVVNQLELGSLASLRLDRPTGSIALATADSSETDECMLVRQRSKTRRARMFDPEFMACIMRVGVTKSLRSDPWLRLATMEPKP